MQVGLLNHYLEQQSLEPNTTLDQLAHGQLAKTNGPGDDLANQHKIATEGEQAEYQPSQKTLMLTAVAEDFNVTDLALDRIDDLQRRLQEFDLLTPITQNAMQILHRLRGEHGDVNIAHDKADLSTTHINAVNVLKYKQQQLQQQGANLYQRRQVTELVRLFSNLESAHTAVTNPVINLADQPRVSA